MQATSNGGNHFAPADVTINVGETVTWTNESGPHNVRFNDGSFEMPMESELPAAWPAGGVMRTFTSSGDFRYYCEAHGTPTSGMSGFVHVVDVTTPPVSPQPGSPPSSGEGGSPGGSPGGGPSPTRTPFRVTLRVSDATPAKAGRLRFFGTVRPAQDGRSVLIQVRTGGGRYRTVAKARLRDAGTKQSVFSVRLRVARDTLFRARMPGRGDHTTGTSRTRRINLR